MQHYLAKQLTYLKGPLQPTCTGYNSTTLLSSSHTKRDLYSQPAQGTTAQYLAKKLTYLKGPLQPTCIGYNSTTLLSSSHT
ncbi:hypothetical protein DPMN_015622 [Dreissena polymorpha]|uniref:Uncharacterized protein n=1 Tax=Dreissena polymorpha TaxID=45954 RepID=A0A9D4NBM6_DREPO|nr:hypothetical protein DPMN_015622 [Dreissena polymorpha]